MKKIYIFIFLLTGFLLSLGGSTVDAASTSVVIKPYGLVYVTANHYSNTGEWDAEGTNNLLSNPAGAAMAAISAGGSYTYQYSCGNVDVVSASCAGGKSCYRNNVYNVTTSCGLDLAEECSNGCSKSACNPPTPGGPGRPVIQVSTSDVCGAKIRISWAPSAGATSYQVYRSTAQDGNFTEVPNSPTTLTDFTDVPGTGTYFYKVKAVNSAGTSLSASASAKASKYCPPLTPPTGETASNASICGGKVGISWAALPGAGGYNVYRWDDNYTSTYNSYLPDYRTYGRSENNFPYYFKYYGYNQGLVTPTGTDSTSFIDTPKGKGPWFYSVAAYPSAGFNKTDMGKLSPAIKVTSVSAQCAPPQTPSNFKAITSPSCGQKTYLSWDKVTGADGYQIMRSTSANGTYQSLSAINGNTLNYTDTPGAGTFFYKIVALSGGTKSAPSGSQQATASAVCKAGQTSPVSLSVKAVPSTVRKGQTCDIEVTVTGADTCVLTGSNGDSKTFDPSKVTKFTSSPIQSRTIYNVTCSNDTETIQKTTSCNLNPAQQET